MEYSLPYLLYFSFLLVVHVIYCTAKKYCENLRSVERFLDCVVIVSFMSFYGLRGFIYTDCFQYYDFFLKNSWYELSYLGGWYEPGYILCNRFIGLFTNNFWMYQFVWTGIDVFLLYKILKRECPSHFFLAFAFLVPLWTGNEMNLFRNTKAILLVIWAFQYIRDRHMVKYFIAVIIASTFHLTALFCLPLYFFIHKDLFKVFVIVSCVSVVLYVIGVGMLMGNLVSVGTMFGGRMETKALAYASGGDSSVFSFGFIYRVFLMCVAIITYKKNVQKNVLMTNVTLIYCCVYLSFSSVLVLRDRFSVIFVLGIVCWLPEVFALISRSMIKKSCVLLNVMFLFAFLFVQTNNPAAKYENVLTGVSSYTQAYSRVFATIGK